MPVNVPTPTWLDRAITWVSPRRGLERLQARTAAALVNGLTRGVDGASSNRLRSDWASHIRSADAATRMDRTKVRNITRDLIQGNPYAAGVVNRLVQNVVGTGIKPQCRLTPDSADTAPLNKPAGWRPISDTFATQFQTDAEALWAEFAESCDVGERMDFYEIQRQIEYKLADDGEVLLHLPVLKRGSRPVSFGIELIECDRLNTPMSKISDPNIRDGVEIDPTTGAAVAYYINAHHPGDDFIHTAKSFGKFQRIERWIRDSSGRIVGPRIIHLFRQHRPGQTRGYSPYAPCLSIFEDMHRYWEAEIIAARVAACHTAFVKSPAAMTYQQTAGTANDAGRRLVKMEPGLVHYGMPGEEISFGDPNRPNSAFGQFTEILLRAIGVCHDLPFELIALNFSKTNYSSARAALLEARRSFRSRQQFQIAHACRPIWGSVITDGILSGRLQAQGFAARPKVYLSSSWTPPAWGWVDPVKEEVAARESIRGMLSTHSEELAARGLDFNEVAEQLAREHKTLKGLDLPSPFDTTPVGEKPIENTDEDQQTSKKEKEDAIGDNE